MARAYIKVYCKNNLVRVFGGNTNEVRKMKQEYENMTVLEFVEKHKQYKQMCKDKNDIVIFFKKQ